MSEVENSKVLKFLRKYCHFKGFPKKCAGRGRRLFAHVLGNIDMLVPREASQEVEFVSKPVFL